MAAFLTACEFKRKREREREREREGKRVLVWLTER